MGALPLVQRNKEVRATAAASAQFTHTLVKGVQYVLHCTADCWYALGSNPTAAANTTGSSKIRSGQAGVLISAKDSDTKIAVIRDTADGFAILDELVAGSAA